jgi:hypothetical protein
MMLEHLKAKVGQTLARKKRRVVMQNLIGNVIALRKSSKVFQHATTSHHFGNFMWHIHTFIE